MVTQKDMDVRFAPARIISSPGFTIGGLGQRYSQQSNQSIPELWLRFAEHVGKVPGQIGGETYGLCCNPDGNGGFEYIAGVEVRSISLLPKDFRYYTLAPQRYAVFEHQGDVRKIGHTFEKIWKQWLPASGEEAADAPEFERYGADFDPDCRDAMVEIWLPLKPS
ncbi:GyrI-like domain-containing protein [Pseudomonas sp. TNT2022 ID681]|uniref:GyrI-like domain-containing protein n=2 Tax=Pseudomonas fontis TaxID=2942633 RepID=A0ABT5P0Z6_9PSED|nr:GyrI-like domain-containing protein [Pseudomonas fontis]MDD0993979.1 GyrI-like domain-containing protein [Pseudomonas fontis]